MTETRLDTGTIGVTLNGKAREVPGGLTVLALIEHLELQPELVVVEHNLQIIRRPEYGSIEVQEGDRVELVHFVGGG